MKNTINSIYKLANELENKIIEYVKSKGGLIDCQPSLGFDPIFAYYNYGGFDGNSTEERWVYGVRYTEENGLQILSFFNDNMELEYDDFYNEWEEWIDPTLKTDAFYYLPTIVNIADNIEEYDAPVKE